MLIEMMHSKIHRVRITGLELNYVGSIRIDPLLYEAVDLLPGQKVQIVNINNGIRLDTYVLEGERGSGQVELNGPAARMAAVGDIVIVIAYCHLSPEEARTYQPKVIFPDEHNRLPG